MIGIFAAIGEGIPGKPVFGSNNAREFGGRGRIKEREWLALLVGLPGFCC